MFESNNLILKIGRPDVPDRLAAILRIVAFLCLLVLQFQTPPGVLTEKRLNLKDGTSVVGEIEKKPYGYNVKLAEGEPKYFKDAEVVLPIEEIEEFRIPAYVLLLGAFYFLFFLPAAFMSLVYNLVAVVIYFLNSMHAFVSGKLHEDLNRFLIKQIGYDVKFQAMFSGMVNEFVHIDLYNREARPFPALVQARTDNEVSRLMGLLRLTVFVPLFVLLPFLVVGIAYGIAFGILTVVHWCIIAATGRDNDKVFELMEIFLRYQARLRLFALGLVERPPPFWGAPVAELDIDFVFSGDEEQAAVEEDYYGTGSARSLEVNLIVYALLLIFSAGMYAYLWLARVTKVMGHDPFTIIAMCLLLPILPLSIIFVRYYRRAEKLLKNEASFMLEILCALPLVNMLIAPLLIQLVLNEYERARRLMKARSA